MGAALIPLMGTPPPSPLNTVQQAYSLQNMLGQGQLTRQAIQENQLKIQAQQEDQNDQNTIQKAFRDAAASSPGKAVDFDAIRTQVAPQVRLRNLQALDADHLKMQQSAQQLALSQSETDKNKFDNINKVNTLTGQILGGLVAEKDPNKQQQMYTDSLPKLKALGVDISQYPPTYPGNDSVMAHAAGVGYLGTILSNAKAYADSQSGQDAALEKRRALGVQDYQTQVKDDPSYQQWRAAYGDVIKGAPATFDPTFGDKLTESLVNPKDQPKYELEKSQAKAAAALTPSTISDMVDRRIDPAKYPEQNKTAKAAAQDAVPLGMSAVQAAIKDSSDSVQSIQKEIDPSVQRARLNLAVATETAKQIALQKLSPDAFAAIQDPRARAQAQLNYEKDSKDYASKVSSAQQLHDFVTAAQSGNKAAPGLIPIAELRQMVSRVNRQELESVSGAGSLYDKIVGKINSAKEGEPIPPEVLKDIDSMSGIMSNAAQRNYNYNLEINRKTYGSKVQPVNLGNIAAVAAPPLPATLSVADKGKVFTMPNGQRRKIVDVNPANPSQFKTGDAN